MFPARGVQGIHKVREKGTRPTRVLPGRLCIGRFPRVCEDHDQIDDFIKYNCFDYAVGLSVWFVRRCLFIKFSSFNTNQL